MRYATDIDAITQSIAPVLGEYADLHDLHAIFDEAFEYRIDTDEAGYQLAGTAGFEQTADDAAFWAIVERHTL